MPLVFSGEKIEALNRVSLMAEDARTHDRVVVMVTHEAKMDYDLQAIYQVAAKLYEADPPTPFLITTTHMKLPGY